MAPSVFDNLSGAVRADLLAFPPNPTRETASSDSRRVPKALVVPKGATAGSISSTGFDVSLECPTNRVVLLSQPQSYFLPWSSSSFVVDDVSYSCAEQYMMAEKASTFQDHRAVDTNMPSRDPSTHKGIGGGLRNIDSAVRGREKLNAVLLGIYPNFTQSPAMKYHSFEL